MNTRILTGITTSGTPHLGNYAGAIRPAIVASQSENVESFYFLANLHSLIKIQDPVRVQRSTLEIAAAWLACGLDPNKVWFYRQSDIPEISELNWLLTCVAGKGLLNRSHAYKAAVDNNRNNNQDDDFAISAGLFMYPVLMSADILLFNPNLVPVGRDQIQHIEMARDFGQRFNHLYNKEFFILPEALIEENVATLPGLDGRKMSKSYDNTIPLFCSEKELKKLIASIVTDSKAPNEPKSTENSALFQLYQAFSNPEQTAEFAQQFADGIAWGEAKTILFEKINQEVSPLREHYNELINNPANIEALLQEGAARLRQRYAMPFMQELRAAVGLSNLKHTLITAQELANKITDILPHFKQYRENDGLFYFKGLSSNGELMIQSGGFNSPQEAGKIVAELKQISSLETLLQSQEQFNLEFKLSSEIIFNELIKFNHSDELNKVIKDRMNLKHQ